jgi:hypothetical protein
MTTNTKGLKAKVVRRLAATFFVLVPLANAGFAHQQSAPVLRVHNKMREGIYLWMKPEIKSSREWRRWFIPKGDTYPITLVSPDRFQVVVEDLQGRQFSAGLLPLRAMIARNPSGTLELGGLFETRTATRSEWSPSQRRWIRRTRQVDVRVAVTYTLRTRQMTYDTITAERSN